MARLKAHWPQGRISWVVNTEWAPLLTDNPVVDETVVFPRRQLRGMAGAPGFIRWCRETFSGWKPDLALDFQGLLRSALIGRASRADKFYGLADAREGARWFYDRVAQTPPGAVHAVERYLSLTELALGLTGTLGADRWREELRFPLPEGTPPQGMTKLLPENFVLLHPFARGTGKSLNAAQIQAFCERLSLRRVVLVGKRGALNFDVPATAVDLIDRTSLTELIWMIRRAASVVSVDSGPSHLAAALGRPLVAIHTWSDPRRVGPYRQDAWVWKNGRLLTMAQIATQPEAFFHQPPKPLSAADVGTVCDRAISLSDSCA